MICKTTKGTPLEFFLLPTIAPFSGILAVLGALLLVELALVAVTGAGISDASAHILHLDALPESNVMNWLFLKEMPFLMALNAFLGGIACTGIAVQGVSLAVLATTLPTALVTAFGCLTGALSVRGLGCLLRKLKFNHTTAISRSEFAGQTAKLLSDTAAKGDPGEAMFKDWFGQKHYVMVEPSEEGVVFTKGQSLILESSNDSVFYPARLAPTLLD